MSQVTLTESEPSLSLVTLVVRDFGFDKFRAQVVNNIIIVTLFLQTYHVIIMTLVSVAFLLMSFVSYTFFGPLIF